MLVLMAFYLMFSVSITFSKVAMLVLVFSPNNEQLNCIGDHR